jgi:hypothetical protein
MFNIIIELSSLLIIIIIIIIICTPRLEKHIYNSHVFNDRYVSQCSEMSIIVKYWSHFIETFFAHNRNLFIQL